MSRTPAQIKAAALRAERQNRRYAERLQRDNKDGRWDKLIADNLRYAENHAQIAAEAGQRRVD